jgi:hypothetical protein
MTYHLIDPLAALAGITALWSFASQRAISFVSRSNRSNYKRYAMAGSLGTRLKLLSNSPQPACVGAGNGRNLLTVVNSSAFRAC